jgi:hypothetical protein
MTGKSSMSGDSKESTKSRQKQTMLEKQVMRQKFAFQKYSKQMITEQVSMEEQMISKALRTLSEEASEDVLEEPGTPLLASSSAQSESPGMIEESIHL